VPKNTKKANRQHFSMILCLPLKSIFLPTPHGPIKHAMSWAGEPEHACAKKAKGRLAGVACPLHQYRQQDLQESPYQNPIHQNMHNGVIAQYAGTRTQGPLHRTWVCGIQNLWGTVLHQNCIRGVQYLGATVPTGDCIRGGQSPWGTIPQRDCIPRTQYPWVRVRVPLLQDRYEMFTCS
jgi:hypothetical protein